jgi:hypothetical protein
MSFPDCRCAMPRSAQYSSSSRAPWTHKRPFSRACRRCPRGSRPNCGRSDALPARARARARALTRTPAGGGRSARGPPRVPRSRLRRSRDHTCRGGIAGRSRRDTGSPGLPGDDLGPTRNGGRGRVQQPGSVQAFIAATDELARRRPFGFGGSPGIGTSGDGWWQAVALMAESPHCSWPPPRLAGSASAVWPPAKLASSRIVPTLGGLVHAIDAAATAAASMRPGLPDLAASVQWRERPRTGWTIYRWHGVVFTR